MSFLVIKKIRNHHGYYYFFCKFVALFHYKNSAYEEVYFFGDISVCSVDRSLQVLLFT